MTTQPSRRDRFRPAELIILSAVIALFVGLVTLMATRDLVLALVFFGITFIVALVAIALMVMALKPGDAEKEDMKAQDGKSTVLD